MKRSWPQPVTSPRPETAFPFGGSVWGLAGRHQAVAQLSFPPRRRACKILWIFNVEINNTIFCKLSCPPRRSGACSAMLEACRGTSGYVVVCRVRGGMKRYARDIHLKGGGNGWKPSSSSNFSIRAFRAYPLIGIRHQSLP